MELLAGVIIGIIVTISLLHRPISINIHKTLEEVRPEVKEFNLVEELKDTGKSAQEDKIFEDDMTGLIEEINRVMRGGPVNGK